jgi:cytochrome c
MTFAGLGKPEDRANVIAFMNAKSDAPKPLPAAPAEAAPDATAAKPGTGPDNGPQKAEKEPVLTEQQAGTNAKNVGGSGAPKVAGTSETDKN